MIYIGADKQGYNAISIVEKYLKSRQIDYENIGVKNVDEDIKLEELIPKITLLIKENKENKGILSCGTGVGVEVGANKFSGIRACLVTNEEIAEWSVIYDNCNILCLSGWQTKKERIMKILDSWFKAKYDGNHDRLKMMKQFDTWH